MENKGKAEERRCTEHAREPNGYSCTICGRPQRDLADAVTDLLEAFDRGLYDADPAILGCIDEVNAILRHARSAHP